MIELHFSWKRERDLGTDGASRPWRVHTAPTTVVRLLETFPIRRSTSNTHRTRCPRPLARPDGRPGQAGALPRPSGRALPPTRPPRPRWTRTPSSSLRQRTARRSRFGFAAPEPAAAEPRFCSQSCTAANTADARGLADSLRGVHLNEPPGQTPSMERLCAGSASRCTRLSTARAAPRPPSSSTAYSPRSSMFPGTLTFTTRSPRRRPAGRRHRGSTGWFQFLASSPSRAWSPARHPGPRKVSSPAARHRWSPRRRRLGPAAPRRRG